MQSDVQREMVKITGFALYGILAKLTLILTCMTVFVSSVNSQMTPATRRSDVSSSMVELRSKTAQAIKTFNQFPVIFEANQGQVSSPVKFQARTAYYQLFLTPQETVFALSAKAVTRDLELKRTASHPSKPPQILSRVVRVQLAGHNVNASPEVRGEEELAAKSNYFLGGDPTQWHTGIPNYARVRYTSVYPGIDQVYYGNGQQMEYDFVIAPGASPGRIRLHMEGADKVSINRHGDLVLHTRIGDIALHKPVVYETDRYAAAVTGEDGQPSSEKKYVNGRFVLLTKNDVGFLVSSYDHSKVLVIDPSLVYSTFLAAETGSTNEAYAVAASPCPNNSTHSCAFITGLTSSQSFPLVNPNPLSLHPGPSNTFISVFDTNASGANSVISSTYLGGGGQGTPASGGYGIAVDSSSNIYVTGTLLSSGTIPTVSALQTGASPNASGFLSKLSWSSGSYSGLPYSTYFHGNSNGIVYSTAVAVDNQGHAFITGVVNSSDLPIVNAFTPGPTCHNSICGSYQTSFLAEFDTTQSGTNSLLFSDYIGGNGVDLPAGIAIYVNGSATNVYVGGGTNSTNLLNSSNSNPICPSPSTACGFDSGFISRISFPNPAISTAYIGGNSANGLSLVTAVAADSSGNLYVGGVTSQTNFPLVSPVQSVNYCALNSSCQAAGSSTYAYNAFVMKLNSSLQTLFSTYLGGSGGRAGNNNPAEILTSVVANSNTGRFYVAGYTQSRDFPLVTPFQSSHRSYDQTGFITAFNSNGSILYSTYFGGTTGGANTILGYLVSGPSGFVNAGNGIAADGAGNVYVVGHTNDTAFPTYNAYQSSYAGGSGDAVIFAVVSPQTPSANVSPSSLTFNPQIVNTLSPFQNVTVTNNGPGALTISSVSVTSGYCNVTQGGTCSTMMLSTLPITIASQNSFNIPVYFYPTNPGTYEGILSLNTNGNAQSVALHGIGIPATCTGCTNPTTTQFNASNVSSNPYYFFLDKGLQPPQETLTATVTSGGTAVTVGTVTFYNGVTQLGPAHALNNSGVATLSDVPANLLPFGNNPILAIYNGSAPYQPSGGSTVVIRSTPAPQPLPNVPGNLHH